MQAPAFLIRPPQPTATNRSQQKKRRNEQTRLRSRLVEQFPSSFPACAV